MSASDVNGLHMVCWMIMSSVADGVWLQGVAAAISAAFAYLMIVEMWKNRK
jgi:hypothetical protein